MTAAQQHQKSLENGEPLLLLQSRQLSCDASRKGMPWRSEQTPVKVATSERSGRKEVTHRIDRRTLKVNKSNDKKIHIASVKKVRFSHMLPDQRDDLNSKPIVYQHKGSEHNRRSEVAPLWYHPFQTGH